MLDQWTRSAILRLREEGHGTRKIARALRVSRGAVKAVLTAGSAEVPKLIRPERAEPFREQVLQLYKECEGNLVRVHEELRAVGAELSYPALTAFCRRHGLGRPPKAPAGHYDFLPGQEMQHDTSPHRPWVGGRRVVATTAALVLCYSRMRFIQLYPRFSRFECKLFLTDALRYFGGAAATCMIDNTHVVVLRGSGADMVPVVEMTSFAERFGFEFAAHAIGDANRSAHAERTFHYVENNLLAGRRFTDWDDLNHQARDWCDRVNARFRRDLHQSPRELFAVEAAHLRPLPVHVPEVYLLHHRIVDSEGYVHVRRNRYSVPFQLIGRRLEVRETRDSVEAFDGPRCVAVHRRCLDGVDARITAAEHRPPRGKGRWSHRAASVHEQRLLDKVPDAADYVALLKKRGRGHARALQWLLRMVDDYPRDAVLAALRQALRYAMTDLERLERMILRSVAADFFVLPRGYRHDSDEDEDE